MSEVKQLNTLLSQIYVPTVKRKSSSLTAFRHKNQVISMKDHYNWVQFIKFRNTILQKGQKHDYL